MKGVPSFVFQGRYVILALPHTIKLLGRGKAPLKHYKVLLHPNPFCAPEGSGNLWTVVPGARRISHGSGWEEVAREASASSGPDLTGAAAGPPDRAHIYLKNRLVYLNDFSTAPD